MYGLPKDFDGAFLHNSRLEVVSFSENTVFFGFDKNVSITVNSSLRHRRKLGDENATVQRVPLLESRLMELLGHLVTHVQADANGTLTAIFENGHMLEVFDDSTNYESYTINDGEHEIFV